MSDEELRGEPFSIASAPLFLTARFPAPQRALGWSLSHPGFSTIREVVWVEVRGAELIGVDPKSLLRAKLAAHGLPDALGFMTARNVLKYHLGRRRAEDVWATCLTTVGLSNAERVGSRLSQPERVGTINTLVHVSETLTEGAMVEALSIVAEARTAAIIETMPARDAPSVTGTGTDCIVVTCPRDGEPNPWAGLHTAIGEAIGGAVYEATQDGVKSWRCDVGLK